MTRLTALGVPADDADVACARLWSAGAAAIEERDAGSGRRRLVTVLARDDGESLRRLGDLPAGWTVEFVDDRSEGSEAWRDHARPIAVNADLVLTPAWQPAPGAGTARTVVTVEPGGAFGLGDHPTTRLSADAAWRLTRPGDRILDVGSGSGVLAIVALVRGAHDAVAIDVAEAAREATADNARRNGVAHRITASCTPLAEIHGTFDVVFANILAPVIVALADDLVRVVEPGGHLVVSGVLADRHAHVIAALGALDLVATRTEDAWACLEFGKPPR